jgi:hypothetical protein
VAQALLSQAILAVLARIEMAGCRLFIGIFALYTRSR